MEPWNPEPLGYSVALLHQLLFHQLSQEFQHTANWFYTGWWNFIKMFSALKKLVGSEPGQLRDKPIPAGLQSMNQSLQRRFAKGVQYNSKYYNWCRLLNRAWCFVTYICPMYKMLLCYYPNKQRVCPSSENCHPGRSEHWKEYIMASTAGQKICGRVSTHSGDPSHKYSLEL